MSSSSEEGNILKQRDEENVQENDEKGIPFFHFILKHPVPFLVIVPIVFAFLIGFGWSIDDRVENKVANIWIPEDGDYAKDQNYAKSLGADELEASTFAALSVSRDNKNIMTDSRLEEIRARMEATENTTVSYKLLPEHQAKTIIPMSLIFTKDHIQGSGVHVGRLVRRK